MRETRTGHTATLLAGGRVLIVRGNFNSSAELYDPRSGLFEAAGSTHTNFLGDHTATLLPDGRVLIAGGTTINEYCGETHAEICDPAWGNFTVTGGLATGRTRHRAAALPDGRVLITGGASAFDAAGDRQWRTFASTAIYDPRTGIFTAGPEMTTPRFWHTAILLTDGRGPGCRRPAGIECAARRRREFCQPFHCRAVGLRGSPLGRIAAADAGAA